MRNLRSYYSASLTQFLQQPTEEILGIIHANNATADTTIQQSNTWEQEIAIMKLHGLTPVGSSAGLPELAKA